MNDQISGNDHLVFSIIVYPTNSESAPSMGFLPITAWYCAKTPRLYSFPVVHLNFISHGFGFVRRKAPLCITPNYTNRGTATHTKGKVDRM